MKSLVLKFVASVSVAFLLLASPFINQANAQEGAGLVLVLDVAKVFKSNSGFKGQMEEIKQEAERLKANIQQQQQAIQKEALEVSKMERNESRNQAEGAVEQKQASLRTQARQAETELLTREAQIYYSTYREMQKVVTALAQENNVSLVLRFESETIDPANRGEVIKGVNRQVVYHGPIDLTTMVIDRMGGQTANADQGVKR